MALRPFSVGKEVVFLYFGDPGIPETKMRGCLEFTGHSTDLNAIDGIRCLYRGASVITNSMFP